MSTAAEAPARDAPHAIASTAAVRKPWLKRAVSWVVLAALVCVVAMIAWTVAASAPQARDGLDPDGLRSTGAHAIAEILRDQGVDVEVVRSRNDVASALRPGSTLALTNPAALTDEAVEDLIEPASSVVFLSTATRILSLVDAGAYAPAGSAAAVGADCDADQFARIGVITPSQYFKPAPGVTGCFRSADDAAAVLIDDRGDQQIATIDAVTLFNNENLATDGNAALAVALLGQSDHLVWYVPSVADGDREAASVDSLGSLTPSWVTPAILLLMLVVVAAGVWRGRRFGPLVAEALPLTVRASETMHGRARLTAKAADAGHAADALREGSTRRLARRLGLDARVPAGDVANAAADRLRVARGSLDALLSGTSPTTDSELIDLARRLADLEQALDVAVRTERTDP